VAEEINSIGGEMNLNKQNRVCFCVVRLKTQLRMFANRMFSQACSIHNL